MHAGSVRNTFLSTMPATRRDHRIALAVVLASTALFVIAVPHARTPLVPIPAFVASYQSALALNDLITAVLLFSQFAIARTWALLLLACAYLFTAGAAIVHGLTFPGLFAPNGLLGAGPQSTVWLYMIWHGGFPVFVLGYASTSSENGGAETRWPVAQTIAASIAAVVVAVIACTWVVTARHDILPTMLIDNHMTPIDTAITTIVWCLALAALLVLWLRVPHSVLDIWLMVVLYAWLLDIALSAILNGGRFDLGFYAGRIYGLCAASFVLVILLAENVALQAQLARLFGALHRQAASDRDLHAERERLFGLVVESANDAIVTKGLDGTITSWNRAAAETFGFSADEAIGRNISMIVPPDRRAEIDDNLARIGRGERIDRYETVRMHKDGRQLDVSLSITPIRSTAGEIIGATKIARDITESRRTQQALNREIEERQRIFETSQDLILVTDSYGNFVQVSPSSSAILGRRPEDMIGHTAVEFIHPEDLDIARREMRSARRGGQMRSFEVRYRHKDGHSVMLNWMGTWSEPARRHFFIGRDLTEKHAAEARARQAQKMEAIGQLTGGVAHDFNNLLTVVTGTIGLLSDAVADDPELTSIAKLIDEAAERGAQLTRHLLAFARLQPLQPVEVDVNALVGEAINLLRPTLGEPIEIFPQLAGDAWMAMVDAGQLTTAVLNLALNARDAMPHGGKLMFETRNFQLDEDYASINSDVSPGDYVMISVSDTGTGIPLAYLEKVFDPFFTTKETGKGTGLGLSMVYGFVKQSGGHIKIYSEEGHGTSVKLYLPRSTGADAIAAATLQPLQIEGGNEVILVVEDDALVRKSVVTQIASLGYAALAAAGAMDALDIIDQDTRIDLLFTDTIMPGGMNGRQLVDEALRRRPALKTLYTSGYSEDVVMHQGRLDPGVLLLVKPYRKHELARMIRVALGS